jgi:hypothetical protein
MTLRCQYVDAVFGVPATNALHTYYAARARADKISSTAVSENCPGKAIPPRLLTHQVTVIYMTGPMVATHTIPYAGQVLYDRS